MILIWLLQIYTKSTAYAQTLSQFPSSCAISTDVAAHWIAKANPLQVLNNTTSVLQRQFPEITQLEKSEK